MFQKLFFPAVYKFFNTVFLSYYNNTVTQKAEWFFGFRPEYF